MKVVTFDIEIKKCIPDKQAPNDPAYKYCAGWKDYENMGIALLMARCSWNGKTLYFDENNLIEFIVLIQEADLIVGFNIWGFDVPLLKATLIRLGLPEKTGMSGKCYDILADIRTSLKTRFPKGWKLENVASATLGEGKSGDGAMAPVLYQEGRFAELYNYGTQDVFVEEAVFMFALKHGYVKNVIDGEEVTLLLEGILKYSKVSI